MRLVPWRMIVGSRVPSASMRRRTTSVASPIAVSSAWVIPASVGRRTKRLESTTWMSHSRWPDMPAPLPVMPSSRSRAASTWVGSRSRKVSWPPRVEMSPISMRGVPRRISVAIWSRIDSSRVACKLATSASSSR